MAYSIIGNPGSKYGPCGVPCAHLDCAAMRRKVAEVCPHCEVAIGFETKYCTNDAGLTVHFWCSIEAANERLPGGGL